VRLQCGSHATNETDNRHILDTKTSELLAWLSPAYLRMYLEEYRSLDNREAMVQLLPTVHCSKHLQIYTQAQINSLTYAAYFFTAYMFSKKTSKQMLLPAERDHCCSTVGITVHTRHDSWLLHQQTVISTVLLQWSRSAIVH